MKKTGIHVLIAEDDAAHANAIRRAFEAAGPETVIKVVGTLQEFRQHCVEWQPNIAVMDLNLPDGRAVEALTCPPEAGPFPILVMTSYGNEQVAVETIKSGALDYVVKSPEAFADMPHTVAHALHEWNLLQERKRAENELQNINRALRLTSLCNQEMVRATDETALLQAICTIAVEHGGYRLAWVGFAEQDEAKSVRPVAHAGFDEDYPDTVNITWADTERGCGPTGTAIRTGQPVLARNIPTDPAFGPWRAAAIQRGYGSSIALPLLGEGHCFGALMMYAAEVDAFNSKEIELLAEMANDLAYGIGALRHQAERKRAEEALRAEERRFQTLAEISPVGIFRTDAQGQTTYVNPRWCQITGLSIKDALGKGWLRAVHPQDREQVARGWHEAVQSPHSSTADYRFVHPDGTVAWVMGQAVPEKDDAGCVVGYVGTITDVTEKETTGVPVAPLPAAGKRGAAGQRHRP